MRKSHRLTIMLIIMLTAASAAFAYAIGRRRAEMESIRLRQVKSLREAFALNAERKKLQRKKLLLLTQPSAIARTARGEYEYALEGERSFDPRDIPSPTPSEIAIAGKPFDFLLGHGGYPWRIPALTFAVSLLFLGAMDVLYGGSDSKNSG